MLRIFEFDLPCRFIPDKPYFIEELSIVVLACKAKAKTKEYCYYGGIATKIIFYDSNKDIEEIFKILISYLRFVCFLNNETQLYYWVINNSGKYKKTRRKRIKDLNTYISECYVKPEKLTRDLRVDFSAYTVIQIVNAKEVDFKTVFLKYFNLDEKNDKQLKIKQLIDLLSFISSSFRLFSKIYDNDNYLISNTFILIEGLIILEGFDKDCLKKCPECKSERKSKKHLKVLMNELVNLYIKDTKSNKIVFDILKAHYKARNDFFHEVKSFDVSKKTIEIALNSNNVLSLENEIKYANAGLTGLMIINYEIRIILISKLLELQDAN